MHQNSIKYIDQNARSNWIRLRTLVLVRWFAIGGQIAALVVAQELFNLRLPLALCAGVIGISVVANILAIMSDPDRRRLTENETLFTLSFDIFQLCLLLSLTGGLNNPFALLVLAPVTVGATVLPNRATLILGSIAVFLVTCVAYFYIPLRTTQGFILQIPHIFVFGYWVAIVTGVAFIAIYTRRVTTEMTSMAEALLATQMALGREQKLTDLGGVVAATAHELGTPLATIKLVSAEMMEELSPTSEMYQDAKLIREQADRCRDILRSMGRAGKDDTHLKQAPWVAVLKEAAEPHLTRGKNVIFEERLVENADQSHPVVMRKPEIIHGLRNLVQNAVDFAKSDVKITYGWSNEDIFIEISDNGPGFPSHIINRIGEPFMRRRSHPRRQGYEGMGLGLFIAKTLLERSKAQISFANNKNSRGALVYATWARKQIEHIPQTLDDNKPIAGG